MQSYRVASLTVYVDLTIRRRITVVSQSAIMAGDKNLTLVRLDSYLKLLPICFAAIIFASLMPFDESFFDDASIT